MTTTTAMSSAERMANNKAVLRQRGVPEKFVEDIARLATPDKMVRTAALAMGALMVVIFGLTLLSIFYKHHVLNFVYGPRTRTADVFVAGSAIGVLGMWLLGSVTVGSIGLVLVGLVTPRKSQLGSARDLRLRAYILCQAGNAPLSRISADPNWASLADLVSAKAFLIQAGPPTHAIPPEAFARSWARFRIICLITASVWVMITFGLFSLARNNYTLIHNDVIEYSSLGQHIDMPLSQASGVTTSCVVTAGRSSESYDPHYFISFQGKRVDLYTAQDTTLDHLVMIDTYLKASRVPMHKLAPYYQLDTNTRACLDKNGTAKDARKSQLIFG